MTIQNCIVVLFCLSYLTCNGSNDITLNVKYPEDSNYTEGKNPIET